MKNEDRQLLARAFGEELVTRRGSESLTAFARRLGVDPGTLHKYESGEHLPGSMFLVALRMKAGVNLNRLIEEAVEAAEVG